MTDLLMPKFGLTMTEGLLSHWHVAAGQSYAAGDLLFTVETEKVANDVEAERDGAIAEILVPAGDTVPVGTPVARLAGGAEAAAAAPEMRDAPSARKLMADHGIGRAAVAGTGRDGRIMKEDVLRVIATPLARRLAKSAGIDLREVAGTGPRNRIKGEDVRRAGDAAAAAAPALPPIALPTPAGVAEIVPDAMRLATARRVSAAKRDIPHFYISHEAAIGALSALRAQLNAEDGRVRITVTHMLIRAVGLALDEMPALNRIWASERILAFARADVGMITEAPDGLRIPVLRDVGNSSLDAIAAAANELARRARGGTLAPADVGDSVISISNVGMFGVTSLTPIINPPNAMTLGVGADRRLFRPDASGAPALCHELTLTLSCDHRVIDGADAARFLSRIVAKLEAPLSLLRPPA